MANRYAVKSGNWSDPTVWDGGTLPGVNDDVRPNGFVVEIDQDVTVGTLTNNASSPAVAGGRFEVSSVVGTRTVTATIQPGLSGHYLVTAAHSTGTLIINGDVRAIGGGLVGVHVSNTGPVVINGNVTVSSANAIGIYVYSLAASTVTINGSVNGSQSSTGIGIYVTQSVGTALTINGNVVGGTGSGSALNWNTTGTCVVNGNVLGGAGGSAIYSVAAITLTVNGNITGDSSGQGIYVTHASAMVEVNGSITASSTQPGVSAVGPTNVRATGPFYNAPNGRSAILTNFLVVPEGENVEWHCTDDSLYPLDGAPVVLSNFVSDSPPPADVRAGVTYGIDGTLTGAAVIPSADSVRAGVPVDTGVGVAVVSPSDIWDHEISTGVRAKDRLMATSTDESTAAILEGALDHGE